MEQIFRGKNRIIKFYATIVCFNFFVIVFFRINDTNVLMACYLHISCFIVYFLCYHKFCCIQILDILILKAKLIYHQDQSVCTFVHNGKLFSLIQRCQNCPFDFKLCMLIPVTVWYDLESVASLELLSESLNLHYRLIFNYFFIKLNMILSYLYYFWNHRVQYLSEASL